MSFVCHVYGWTVCTFISTFAHVTGARPRSPTAPCLRLGRAYIGVDRHTAAKYGFDDKVATCTCPSLSDLPVVLNCGSVLVFTRCSKLRVRFGILKIMAYDINLMCSSQSTHVSIGMYARMHACMWRGTLAGTPQTTSCLRQPSLVYSFLQIHYFD